VLVVVVVVGGGVYYGSRLTADPPVKYRTVKVVRGDLSPVVNATGTVEPQDVVDVGAQVTGVITALGIDEKRSTPTETKTIDYDSDVEAGTVLARIDDRIYKAQLLQAKATLEKAVADLEQMKAKLFQAEQDLKRADALKDKIAIAMSDYDLAVANEKVAKANVTEDQAMIDMSQAQLDLAQANLDYTTIKAPVKGKIISRRVNVGQTVVSNLSASSLFLLAKDLSRIQVWASVNEADIGRIHPGVPVSFTVDTFQGETFHGTVVQVRKNAQMTQNVVTYTVVVETDNADLKLLPYLTATLKFEIEHYSNVLKVSNAAIRWKPKSQRVLPEFREAFVAGTLTDSAAEEPADAPDGRRSAEATAAESKPADAKSSGAKAAEPKPVVLAKSAPDTKSADTKSAGTKSAAGAKKSKSGGRKERGLLWVCDEQKPSLLRPVHIRIGATDGVNTIVIGKDVKQDMEVISGEVAPTDASSQDAASPFAPSFMKKSATPKKDS
jgi:HlyD family secretion protein